MKSYCTYRTTPTFEDKLLYSTAIHCRGERKLNRKNMKDTERFQLCLLVKPFPVAERIWNHLGHAGSLHFSDIQPCSGQTPFPVSAIHSNHRTNENNLNGKRISLGGKDGDTPSVRVGKLSRWDQDLDRRFNLFPYLYQTSHYAWINEKSKHLTDSQTKPENTTFTNVCRENWTFSLSFRCYCDLGFRSRSPELLWKINLNVG